MSPILPFAAWPMISLAIKRGSTMNKSDVSASFPIGRRELVLAATAALAVSSRRASAQAPAGAPAAPPNIVFEDNLAVPLPVPAGRSFGRGKDRALALGG